jgi:hypothetical protein
MKEHGLKRIHYFDELIETESNYLRNLHNIITDFKHPLETENILTTDEIYNLFTNIEEIRDFNLKFLE